MQDDKLFFQSLTRLQQLRQSANQKGSLDADEWLSYLQVVMSVCKTKAACVLMGDKATSYTLIAPYNLSDEFVGEWLKPIEIKEFIGKAQQKGYGVRMPNPQLACPDLLLAVALRGGNSQYLLLLTLDTSQTDRINDVLLRAMLIADVLPVVQSGPSVTPPKVSSSVLMPLLELLDEIYRARHFQTAAFALVNSIVRHCPEVEQAVFGWREGAYLRVRAISHFERFERKTDTMRYFEAALEEAADQGMVLQVGKDLETDSDLINVAHRQMATHLGSQQLVTLPLFDDAGETVGALMLVSYKEPINQPLQSTLQFIVQTALSHLKTLREDESGIVLRSVRRFNRGLGQLVGPENLWVKISVLTLSVFLILTITVQVPHRIKGTARFVTDETRLLVAPFNSVINDVWVSSGDTVTNGQKLIALDTQELMLQLAELESELQRNQAELDRARAEFTNVDMAIAAARLEQTRARIEQVNYLVSQATLSAPFDGIVVEGDRRDLLSSPVNRGNTLMRIAQASGLYLMIEVSDIDIQYVQAGSTGEFALVSQPREPIPLAIERIVPMAVAGSQGGAVFEVRAKLAQLPENWWRPGMTGVARIDAGQRSLLWVWFHKAWNRLRLFMWW